MNNKSSEEKPLLDLMLDELKLDIERLQRVEENKSEIGENETDNAIAIGSFARAYFVFELLRKMIISPEDKEKISQKLKDLHASIKKTNSKADIISEFICSLISNRLH